MDFFRKIDWPFKLSLRSITFRWTIITSIVISSLFTVFAIVTYKTSSQIMIQQEKEGFQKTMDEIDLWLSRSDQLLTQDNTISYLKKSAGLKEKNDTENSEIHLDQLNDFVSELFQPELNVKIYNTSSELIFENKEDYLPFDIKKQKTMKIKTLDGVSGLLLLKPIYSNETKKLVGYVQGFFELNDYYDVREDLIRAIIVLEIIGVIISLIVGFILSSYFTNPLRKMASVLNSIEDAHKTGNRMPILKRQDEIFDLAVAFNDMIERMEKFILRQNQFVEDVSHELRTPVAVIEGHLSLLTRWGKDDPEVLEESLEASLQEIIRMKSLVEEMLDISRLEQSEFQHTDATSTVKDIVHANVNNFRMLYPDFNFYLDDDLKKDLEVKIYRNHLEQILIILMDNAVKYSTNRKEVVITLTTINESIQIMIQDFGEGISKEDLEKIFDRFYRVDRARTRSTGGNGLGLSIAYQLIENYNGTIDVKSHLNKGSAFIFTLPIAINENDIEQK